MVERINAGELEEVWEDTFNVVMQNGTDPEELQENIDYYLKDKGEFQGFRQDPGPGDHRPGYRNPLCYRYGPGSL